ncbi:MAG: DUF805 domain-containing protein [Opitutae bacterium]|nr:DUF805 domain-containing protein [Opitutae bacterium]
MTFWRLVLVLLAALLVNFVFAGMVMPSDPALAGIGGLIAMPGLIAIGLVSLAAQVKRWHDLDRSGWMVLVSLVPIVGFLVNLICLGFLRGTAGANRFGEPEGVAPRAAAGSEPPLLASAALPDAPPPLPSRPRAPMSRGARWALIGGAVVLVLVPALGGLWWMLPGSGWSARKSWLMAKAGSATECYAMGLRCRKGADGFRADDAAAAKWFEVAARAYHTKAQYDLGVLYFYGLGVPADRDRAREWLDKAARSDYAPAMTLLGLMEEQDLPLSNVAFELWQKAAAAGDPWAESLLGSAYLARGNPLEGDENFVRALYWLETARRDGVETVGGLLRHVWANLPAERVEAVTEQVFARLERDSPEPVTPSETATNPEPPATAESTPSTAETPTAENNETPTPASSSEDDPAVALRADVLENVRALEDYTRISTLYAERSQADADWTGSDEGRAVGQYLQRMRTDAQSLRRSGEGDTVTLDYTIGGATHHLEGVRVADLASDADYRQFVVESIARNIVTAPRPLAVAAFLRAAEPKEGEEK